MKTTKCVALLFLLLFLASCGSPIVSLANAQSNGGNSILNGQYVFESFGTVINYQVPYFESGLFVADGNGHGTLTSQAASFDGINPINSTWTFTLNNFTGDAYSSVGDHAKVFCTVTGKICIMVEADPASRFPWQARFERE